MSEWGGLDGPLNVSLLTALFCRAFNSSNHTKCVKTTLEKTTGRWFKSQMLQLLELALSNGWKHNLISCQEMAEKLTSQVDNIYRKYPVSQQYQKTFSIKWSQNQIQDFWRICVLLQLPLWGKYQLFLIRERDSSWRWLRWMSACPTGQWDNEIHKS